MSGGLALAWRLARRELRGGLQGFRIFLTCLALGVMAIAGVGTIRSAIQAGFQEQGASLLGGDAQMRFTYRFADESERAYMAKIAEDISQVVDFRSMVLFNDETALTQIKAVDDLYPLVGTVELSPPITLDAALSHAPGAPPRAVMERVLAERLGLKVGDRFNLGVKEFELGAVLRHFPDSAAQGITLGPRTILRYADLDGAGLIGPGAIFQTEYRMRLPANADLQARKQEAQTLFKDKGMRWTDRRRPAPRMSNFIERLGTFLVFVGLAGMAVGGVGISAAVRDFLNGKTHTIATLKTLGAEGGLIFKIYLLQIAVLTSLGVALGLALGVAVPLFAAPAIAQSLPFPIAFGLYPAPLFEAAFYGCVTAFLFALLPLARARLIRAAALYRGAGGMAVFPGWRASIAVAVLASVLVGGAMWFSQMTILTLSVAGGVVAALAVLALAAFLLRFAARTLARSALLRGRTMLRLALASIGGPQSDATSVVLSLGLGLTVLASVGQIDANLRNIIRTDLPDRAPSFFFIDIQPDQITPFLDAMTQNPNVSRVDQAPILRGVLSEINGRPAREVAGGHWVVTGDRGITYATQPTSGTKITAGTWWPQDYTGPPQVSFAAEEAAEIGLGLGDVITVNVLGRDISATITSLREVDFSSAGIGFVMTFNPSALAGAPHSHIATVYAEAEAEAQILRETAKAMPNITAIRVKDAIERVGEAMSAIATATAWASAATLLTGFAVLIGAAAAGERARTYEAAILKVLGASRAKILLNFALRAAFTGAAAGAVAVAAGGLAGWAIMRFVMESRYEFQTASALGIVFGGALLALLAGMVFAWRPLATRPAQILRAQN